MVKSPFELALDPLLLWNLKPRTILEIGSKEGGSALWFADMATMLGIDAHVVSIDLLRVAGIKHDGITFLGGDGRNLGGKPPDRAGCAWLAQAACLVPPNRPDRRRKLVLPPLPSVPYSPPLKQAGARSAAGARPTRRSPSMSPHETATCSTHSPLSLGPKLWRPRPRGGAVRRTGRGAARGRRVDPEPVSGVEVVPDGRNPRRGATVTGSTPASQRDVSGGGRACAIVGLLGLVAAVWITAAARGDALPEDTRRIQGLSPEQARTLAAEFPGVDVVVTWHGNEQPLHHALPLDGLQTLDAETAQALAGYTKGPILLGGLTALDAGTARELAEFHGFLVLDGIRALDADTARGLADFNGPLHLNGVTSIDKAVAAALAGCTGAVYLRGLKTLDDVAAEALAAARRCSLHLDGLATIDAATARALAESEGDMLSLDGLTAIDPDTATALAAFNGDELSLDGVATLSAETAGRLAKFNGDLLSLQGLETIDAPTARALAKCGAGLDLVGLARLDADLARALAGGESEALCLDGLTTLDVATARVLREFGGDVLSLGGLTALDADAARELAGWQGEALCLDGLTTLDATAASRLAAFGGSLSLRGLATLDAGTAAALAANDRWDGHLPDLHTLDSVAVAAALAAREGPLTLPWLKKSSLQALAALARKEDVEIPPLDSLELIPAPDGGPHDDVVIPDAFRERQRGLWLGPGARPAADDPAPETF
jgi:hypothetical protein